MRIQFFITLLILTVRISSAQTSYIAAPNGLALHKTASSNSEVVKTLPYGAKLHVFKESINKVKYKSKEADGFYLSGYWQKVAIGIDTGYVFDALLIPVNPVDKVELETYYSDTTSINCMPFDVYFLANRFKPFGTPFDIKKYEMEDSLYYLNGSNIKNAAYCNKGFKQKFSNGNIIIDYTSNRGGYSMDVSFKGFTFNQVYAIALSLTTFSNERVKVIYKNSLVSIVPEDMAAGCYSSIKIKGNKIIWNYFCGC